MIVINPKANTNISNKKFNQYIEEVTSKSF